MFRLIAFCLLVGAIACFLEILVVVLTSPLFPGCDSTGCRGLILWSSKTAEMIPRECKRYW